MSIKILRLAHLWAGIWLAVLSLSGPAPAVEVEQWDVWELSLDGPDDGNPYLERAIGCHIQAG